RPSARDSLSRPIFPAWYFGRHRHRILHLSRMANQTAARLHWLSILTTTFLARFLKVSTTKPSIFLILRFLVTAIMACLHARSPVRGCLVLNSKSAPTSNDSGSRASLRRQDSR